MAQITKEDIDAHVESMKAISSEYAEGKINVMKAAKKEALEIKKFRDKTEKANKELARDLGESRAKLERGLEEKKLEVSQDDPV